MVDGQRAGQTMHRLPENVKDGVVDALIKMLTIRRHTSDLSASMGWPRIKLT